MLASILGLLAATWLTARVLRPLRRGDARRCGASARAICRRARASRGSDEIAAVAAGVQQHGRAARALPRELARRAAAGAAGGPGGDRQPARSGAAARRRRASSGRQPRRSTMLRDRHRARGRSVRAASIPACARWSSGCARTCWRARAPTSRRASRRPCAFRRRPRASACCCRAATPIYGEDGTVAGAAIVLQDVTRLFRFDELKNNLVATVAHEFRTPLTSLRMALHLCTEEVVGPLTPQAGRPAVRRARGLRAPAGHRRRAAEPVAHRVRDASSCTAAAPIPDALVDMAHRRAPRRGRAGRRSRSAPRCSRACPRCSSIPIACSWCSRTC